MGQVVECQHREGEALSSKPSTTTKKKERLKVKSISKSQVANY
jgi:hypothetical protein